MLFRLTEVLFRLTKALFRLTEALFRLTGVPFCHFAISCFKHAPPLILFSLIDNFVEHDGSDGDNLGGDCVSTLWLLVVV